MHFIISLEYHVEEISLATTKSCVLVTMFDHLTCVIAFVELMQKSEKDKSIYFKRRYQKNTFEKKYVFMYLWSALQICRSTFWLLVWSMCWNSHFRLIILLTDLMLWTCWIKRNGFDEIGDNDHECDDDASPVWNMQSWFSPHNIEIGTELHTVLLEKVFHGIRISNWFFLMKKEIFLVENWQINFEEN